jgi:REP element-mobilizing transposase RayT
VIPVATNPQRKSPRLKGYDYSQEGAYFVTLCTHQRANLFGAVLNEAMMLSEIGVIADAELINLVRYWDGLVDVDLFVVMLNHIHAIIILTGMSSSASAQPDTQKRVPTLGNVVGSYKSRVTRRVREMSSVPDLVIWQRRYHDHIVRNETSLNQIRAYIINNPALWQRDVFFTFDS